MMRDDVDVDSDNYKSIAVDKLMALLATLPAGCELYANHVGNLGVQNPDCHWLGYISISEEKWYPSEDEGAELEAQTSE